MFGGWFLFILTVYSISNAAQGESISTDKQIHKRHARATNTPLTIEVLVVADESMVKFHGNVTVRPYVLTIMAKVS